VPRANTLPDDPVTTYADKVVRGEILAGPHVRGACQRHLDDLSNDRGLVFDIPAAMRALEFFPDVLRLNGGDFEGEPFHAVAMVEQSPDLEQLLHLGGGIEKHNIAYLDQGSFFRPISSEERGRGQSGPRPHCALLDEVHEHPTNAMVEFMRAGTKGRRQALIAMITNSGSDRQSVCWEYHDYTAKVCSGALKDDAHFGYVCAVDEDEDPLKSEDCWPKANPSLGVTFLPKYLREQVVQARGMPSKENIVRRLNFCQWTEADEVWISRHLWEAAESEIDLSALRGRPCSGGLDLSAKLDLTALALAWPAEAGEFGLEDDGVVAALWFWTPGDTIIDREDKDRVPYRQWRDDGHLIAVPGKTIDYRYVSREVGELLGRFAISNIHFDRWRIDDLKRELDSDGVMVELTPFGQGFKDMSPAVDKLEELIVSGRFRVLRNPVLTWNASSAVLATDPAGNRKFAKDKATGRIDGIVALAQAVAAVDGDAPVASPWEDPDFRMVM